jgi:hypothetical protein
MTESKDGAKRSDDPRIDDIDPTSVKQNDEVTLSVIGANFSANSFVFIDGHSPRVEHESDTRLKVKLTREITGSLGSKAVKVHDAETGALSNEKTLTVKRASK